MSEDRMQDVRMNFFAKKGEKKRQIQAGTRAEWIVNFVERCEAVRVAQEPHD